MDLIFQIWGGMFYLSNKIMLAISEGRQGQAKKSLRIKGWVIYILGVPAWVTILINHHDWIAASIQVGCVPAMLLGIYNTYHDNKRQNKLFNIIVALCTYLSLVFGLGYSVIDHGGITSISQVLEIGVMLGFLFGSYAIARNNAGGWYFFMLMNLSMAALMILQGKPILMAQQLLSLCFVVYGLNKSRNYVYKEC
ncbi:MAG: hypothetical protein QS721_06540 [Candidatus Endonucleobacter sp. (ex Gigantidas childressi)]|nr:hypothetical protein [Candidatus Endonucleobacter sp. (ex Gigantidas childressi)]